MATDVRSFANNHVDDASFRVWGSGISAALAAVGLVQAADTGQINWTTVTRPGAGIAAGYEIWRLNDALQATAPFFLKIEYGTGGAALRPEMWLTIGTGTNGAGTLTGNTTARNNINTTPQDGESTARPSYTSGDGSRMSGLWRASASSGSYFIMVERTRDAAGAYTNEGVYYALGGSGGQASRSFGILPSTGVVPTKDANAVALAPHASVTGVRGTDVAVYPWWFSLGYIKPSPLSFLSFFSVDMSEFVTPIVMYGASHNYRAMSLMLTAMALDNTNSPITATSVLMLWE